MSDQRGVLSEGFRRAWRYQRVLWWIFVINLLLAVFAAHPIANTVAPITDHSLQASRLSEVFDFGAYSELASNPEVKLFSLHGVSLHFTIVFFVFMLFLTGGILEAYRADRRLTTREFFEACGCYFWRWVRLLILMAIVLVPVVILVSLVGSSFWKLEDNSPHEKTGYWVFLFGMTVVGLLLMCIRIWFDMAQVRAVVEEETGMWHNAGRAFKLTFGNFATLFWLYLRISVLNWLAFAVGLYVWAKMPPARFEWTIFFLELVVLAGFATRLWQRASEMVWYQRRFLIPAAAPVPITPAPVPLLTIAPPPATPAPQT